MKSGPLRTFREERNRGGIFATNKEGQKFVMWYVYCVQWNSASNFNTINLIKFAQQTMGCLGIQ